MNKYILSLNAYALYFVKNFWLNDGQHSENNKIGSSLGILMIVNFAWLDFINHFLPFNWKATLFFVCCFHLFISVFFSEEIVKLTDLKKSIAFMRYYPFFILYLSIGVILLFIDVFYF